jgi:hypothetical protein
MSTEELKPNNEGTPRPNTLDIVSIDGRLAQTNGSLITYLDNGKSEFVDWDQFILTKKANATVGELKKLGAISEEELQKIHWGPEQETYPHLREEVNFFGEYRKREGH